MSTETSNAQSKIKRILVTGDAGIDFDVYLHFAGLNPPPGAKPTHINQTLGGAGLAYRILTTWARNEASAVGFAPPLKPTSPVFAAWNLKPLEAQFKSKSSRINAVWRLVNSVNPGELTKGEDVRLPEPVMPEAVSKKFIPDVILIQDDAAFYRHPRGESSPVEQFWNVDAKPVLVWKMSPPLCRGEVWWKAAEAGVLERTLVAASLNDLRRSPVRISCGISWERTALDIARELEANPALAELRRASNVVIIIHGEGALWRRTENGQSKYTLFFDASHMERETCKPSDVEGTSYGYHTTFAATLTAALASSNGSPEEALSAAIPNGLHAMRLLHILGHGADGDSGNDDSKNKPGFPLDQIASVIRSGKNGCVEINPATFSDYAVIDLPLAEALDPNSKWSIALSDPHRPADEPLYGLARRVAVFGESQLHTVPHARFGKLLTADRNEIEALRNLKTLIEEYSNDAAIIKPLSLAVFGPPGAGKSFGVKQIAKEVLGKNCPVLEFNLSQFTEADLAGAFHQVRDEVLKGAIPVVFWDEFDSSSCKWLQHLLAPMNDGKFQEGQLTHPIGRCIFVFAGSTSYDMESFGPKEPDSSVENNPDAIKNWAEFKLLKGPDFISRIHGSLNVLGPNPKKSSVTADLRNTTSTQDVSFPLRRAILLRALLGIKGSCRLEMEAGLLAAFLEVGEFTNGARSFEKICLSLKAAAAKNGPFMPSHLPSDAVLAMNVTDLDEFKALLRRDEAFQHLAEKLAPAIHLSFLSLADRNNPNKTDYENLTAETKADNMAAARRIPWLLGLAGLYITDADAPGALSHEEVMDILDDRLILELLAEEEHDLWMALKQENGWRVGDRDNMKRFHGALIPYKRLPQKESDKDHANIQGIPERVALAEFAIVNRKPKAK